MIKCKDDYLDFINYEIDNYVKSYPIFTKEHKRIIKFQKIYRKYEYYYNCKKNSIMFYYLKNKYERLSFKYTFHIPINVIDKGLCIVHIGPIYINDNSKIGKNFRIHPMTTIGKSIGRSQVSPKIGDGVWVGPGARIYGDISIGNNVVIGTNSVVNKSFSSNVTVAGVPGKVINSKGYMDYFD